MNMSTIRQIKARSIPEIFLIAIIVQENDHGNQNHTTHHDDHLTKNKFISTFQFMN